MKDSKQNRTLINKRKNHCSAEFRANYTKYWSGTSISFSGNYAKYFYKAISGKKLDWDILDFEDTNLGRIDLCYDLKLKQSDRIENLDLFLKNCEDLVNFRPDNRKAKVVKGVLRVGRRSSPNFFRVYQKPNGKYIRFELEMKNLSTKKFQYYLFSNQLEKFEELIATHFYKQALNTFVMDSSYTD